MKAKSLSCEWLNLCRSCLMQGFTDFVFNKRQLEELKEALKLKGEIKIVRDYGYCQEIKLIRYDGKFKNKRERYI